MDSTSLGDAQGKPEDPDYQNFAKGRGPNISKRIIDFEEAGLPEYDGLYAVVLDSVLSAEECRTLIRLAEQSTGRGADGKSVPWERAMVNIGNGMQMMAEDTRKCGRIIFDSQHIVDRLWERIKNFVPELQELANQRDVTGKGPVNRREIWKMTRLNERMRFLKYTGGEYFKCHQDGVYETPDKRERTYYTVHLYLNEGTDDEPLEGGATTFHSVRSDEKKLDVKPRMGSVLIFQQKWLYHAGSEVIRGTKMTMRTELMYEKADELTPPPKADDLGVDYPASNDSKTQKRTKLKWVKNRIGNGF